MRRRGAVFTAAARELEQHADEQASREITAAKPIVEDVEYRRQPVDRRVRAPLNLRLQPAASPKHFMKIERRNRKIGLRLEVLVERRLGVAGLRENRIDPDASNAVL